MAEEVQTRSFDGLLKGAVLVSVYVNNAVLIVELDHGPGRQFSVLECGTGGLVTVEGGAFPVPEGETEDRAIAHAAADLALHFGDVLERAEWSGKAWSRGRLRLEFRRITVTLEESLMDDLGIWIGPPGCRPFLGSALFFARDGQVWDEPDRA